MLVNFLKNQRFFKKFRKPEFFPENLFSGIFGHFCQKWQKWPILAKNVGSVGKRG